MKRIYVEEKWCLGCHLCEYNCAFASLNATDMAKALKGAQIHPNIRIEQKGDVSFAVSCRHCEEPHCMAACISGAISIQESRVCVDQDKCVSCYTCVMVCPYGAVMPSETGAVQKCDLCTQSMEGLPACVSGCPNRAIVFEERKEGAAWAM